MRRLSLVLILCLYPLAAQDAGLVLRTSVTYTTQRNSLSLTDEQKKEADRLSQEAREQSGNGNYAEAMRRYQDGMAVMRGVEWTPAVELISSLQGHLDHAMLDPGKQVAVSLTPLYPSERAAGENVFASVFLVPVAKEGPEERILGAKVAADPTHLPFKTSVTLPETPNGDYNLEVRMTLADGTSPQNLRTAFVKTLPIHIESLSAQAERLKERPAKVTKRDAASLPTAQYVLARYEQTDHGNASPLHYNFQGEFATANAILDALEAGRDPFAGKQGDLRKAYLSKVDQTLQPYRVFIPTQYDGTKPTPLVVALHGMGGDENSMFDGYGEQLKVEAQRLGFLVACPKGRDTASMYRGSAEQDVMDVLAEVRRDYKVDSSRIYLMGHSMGGYGTWSVAIAHPDVFAALGPISGGGNAAAMEKIKNLPEYVIHGDHDPTVNVNQSRTMVAAGKKVGAPIVYNEVPGGTHISVAQPAFAPMFDFFAKQSKPAAVSTQ